MSVDIDRLGLTEHEGWPTEHARWRAKQDKGGSSRPLGPGTYYDDELGRYVSPGDPDWSRGKCRASIEKPAQEK